LFGTEGQQPELPEFAANWPGSGMWDAGAAYELQMWGPATSESGSSLWPTVLNRDYKMTSAPIRKDTGKHRLNQLPVAAMLWQTPSADPFRSRGGSRKHEMGLDKQARIGFWQTPLARDGIKAPTPAVDLASVKKGRYKNLNAQIADSWQTPLAKHAKPSLRAEENCTPRSLLTQVSRFSLQGQAIRNGSESSRSDPILRRRLNPRFVEWLMGFPIGWTEP
jgi:hypothetical protein